MVLVKAPKIVIFFFFQKKKKKKKKLHQITLLAFFVKKSKNIRSGRGKKRFLDICLYMIFVSPEICSERDYVITHSVRSMYVVFCKIDHCIHIH